MAEHAAEVEMPGVVHLYSTTALDRSQDLSLSIMTTPIEAFASGAPLDARTLAEALGAELVGDFDSASDEVLPAILASVLLEDSASGVVGRIDRILSPGDPLSHVPPSVHAFVEHCINAPIVGVEESPLSGKTLRTIIATAGTLGVAAIMVGTGLVVAIAATAATVVVINATAMAVEYVADKIAERKVA